MHVVESVRRSRVTGSLIGSDGSASMHGEHVELYSEEESSTGEEEEEDDEEEEEEVVEHGDHDTVQPADNLENRPPTAGIIVLIYPAIFVKCGLYSVIVCFLCILYDRCRS